MPSRPGFTSAPASAPSKLKLQVWRTRATHTVSLELARAGDAEAGASPSAAEKSAGAVPGLALQPLSEEQRDSLGVGGDFWVDEKQKQAHLTEAGHQRVEELMAAPSSSDGRDDS